MFGFAIESKYNAHCDFFSTKKKSLKKINCN